jgi:tripartite-type tricarboxylate transporter receptor subunit TctC
MKHVPYKGSGGAANDLVAGVVESSFAGVPNAMAQVPAGRLKALAVTTSKRIPQLPDVPTMQEAGVPGYNASVWLGLLAPAGTPKEVVMKLNAEIAKVLSAADTKKELYAAGVEADISSPEALNALMVQELDRWGKVIKDAGITMQ